MNDDIRFLRRQLAEAEENLRLLQERKSEYVLPIDIPLHLIKAERRLEEQIADLRKRLEVCQEPLTQLHEQVQRERLQRPRRWPVPGWPRWAVPGGVALVLLLALAITLGPRLIQPPAEEPTTEPTLESDAIWTRPADGMVMVHVPGGTFEMGSIEGESDEQPVHTVVLDGFWIDRTEVTNALYHRCVEANACQAPTVCDWGAPTYARVEHADHPAVCVDWYGAEAYCEWAGARLPTEAEWEYAARGSQGWAYPWGNEFDGTRLNYCDVNCEENWADETVDDGYARTAPVGGYPDGASWCGALDMAGNVWEWMVDWHGSYPSAAQANPTGPETGDRRVLRGAVGTST